MKALFLLYYAALIAATTGCQESGPLEGKWDMELMIQEKTIPFQLEFKNPTDVELVNGAEVIPLSYSRNKQSILIPIQGFDANLELNLKDGKLNGFWNRPSKVPPYHEVVKGSPTSQPMRLPDYPLPFKWKMELIEKDESTDAILLFSAHQDGKYASILTPTGDYRYLTPNLDGDTLTLTGFDGVFAFYVTGELEANSFVGKLYAGKSWNQDFKASVNEGFELPDPTEATKYKGDITKVELPLLEGDVQKVINAKNQGQVKIIQIFGSWCPNCIDETRFLTKWSEENKDKNVSISMISFERSPNKKHALKMLKKSKKLYGINYPIYIGGYEKSDKVEDALPGLENFISFPTTLFIDKKNNVRKIHAGFSGPATGKYYDKFVMDFNSLVDKLLSE